MFLKNINYIVKKLTSQRLLIEAFFFFGIKILVLTISSNRGRGGGVTLFYLCSRGHTRQKFAELIIFKLDEKFIQNSFITIIGFS